MKQRSIGGLLLLAALALCACTPSDSGAEASAAPTTQASAQPDRSAAPTQAGVDEY